MIILLSEIESRTLAMGEGEWTDLVLAKNMLENWFGRRVRPDELIRILARLVDKGLVERRIASAHYMSVVNGRAAAAGLAKMEFKTTDAGTRFLKVSANDAR